MDSKKKFYLVSFGHSDIYTYVFTPGPGTNDHQPLQWLDEELTAFLAKKFPGDSFAYYTTPKATEISWHDRDKYKNYHPLDAEAIEEIKKQILKEAEDQEYLNVLNDNAPQANATFP